MKIQEGLTYDDVLLVPKYSEVKSRANVDLSVDLGKGIVLQHPIIPANMKSITEGRMVDEMDETGGLALIHRFMSVDDQIIIFNMGNRRGYVGCSVGVKEEDKKRVDALIKAGCKIICVDVAHAHSKLAIDMVKYIYECTYQQHPDVLIIAGNVATPEGALALDHAGARVIKVGIGPGSLCTTRVETGCGVPQLTALKRVSSTGVKLIADGGIKNAGDIVKALCFADAVMVGNVVAGTKETPGKVVSYKGGHYKQYEGSSTYKSKHIEGVSTMVPVKGSVSDVIEKLLQGVRSGCSYQGAKNLEGLKKNPEFIKVSSMGYNENKPHLTEVMK